MFSVGCLTEASVMQLLCKLPSVTATQVETGPFRDRSAQVKAYGAYHGLRSAKELTKILLLTRNSAVQPGRSQPRCCEAFLRLAK